MKALQQKAPKSASKRGGRANGSDFSSARGSEERHVAAQGGRGPRRNRDYDLEPVSARMTFFGSALFRLVLCLVLCSPPRSLKGGIIPRGTVPYIGSRPYTGHNTSCLLDFSIFPPTILCNFQLAIST